MPSYDALRWYLLVQRDRCAREWLLHRLEQGSRGQGLTSFAFGRKGTWNGRLGCGLRGRRRLGSNVQPQVGELESIIYYVRPCHERFSIPHFSLDDDNDNIIIKHDEHKSSIYPSPRIPHGCQRRRKSSISCVSTCNCL